MSHFIVSEATVDLSHDYDYGPAARDDYDSNSGSGVDSGLESEAFTESTGDKIPIAPRSSTHKHKTSSTSSLSISDGCIRLAFKRQQGSHQSSRYQKLLKEATQDAIGGKK